MPDILSLLVAVVGGLFWLVKRYAEQRDANRPQRAREEIDATLASGNAVGVSQLLDKLHQGAGDCRPPR